MNQPFRCCSCWLHTREKSSQRAARVHGDCNSDTSKVGCNVLMITPCHKPVSHNMHHYSPLFEQADNPQSPLVVVCMWSLRYEPWVMVDRVESPWHDARFRGYGADKVSYITTLHHANFTFLVHPDVWMIHREHPKSHAR